MLPRAHAGWKVPSWVYLFTAVSLFAYQTLDAIDGKQARRTGSATPLGELFDHGCDSVSSVFVAVALCVSLGLESEWPLMLVAIASVAFYVAHWRTYVTGKLYFGK